VSYVKNHHFKMINSKLPGVGTTIFTVMSQLANEHKAINLGQGFPDFEPDQRLRDLVSKAMNDGFNQYPPMPGVPALREAISDKVAECYGRRYDAQSEVTVTSGATEALMSTILACAGAGDEVIVIEPCFDTYRPAITLAGATPVSVPMRSPTADHPYYRIDWDRVRDVITPRTRALILNSPHNPTGSILSEADLDALEQIVEGTRILIISDEVYEHIVFDGERHLSVSGRPALADRAFVISSFGKTYHVTGWKIGYCCAPASLTAELRLVHQFMIFTVPSIMQVGIAEFMRDPTTFSTLSSFYQDRRDELTRALKSSRLNLLPSAGTFFMLAEYGSVSDMPEADFAKWLTIEHGVTCIPVSAFYKNPESPEANHQLVRLCFAKRSETLREAARRLLKV